MKESQLADNADKHKKKQRNKKDIVINDLGKNMNALRWKWTG